MASTYSDNLKLQLMATGENAGTWGTVTNVNLGTAIEEALGGTVDVTFASGTVTLTASDDNTTQQYRHMRLNLTGTSGGAQDLEVPAVEKVYIVNNGCADAITIKVSGQTGVAVPAGKTMFVYNNGTDCVDAVTHLSSLTLASPLPVASGGTGSNTATFSGANISSINASNISSGTLANARTTASSSNGASTIVARDASGDFAAATITATAFSGSGASLTSLNASNVSAGTLDNARTNASSANGASTLVARDATGNFAGNTITGVAFSGSGASLTSLNAESISAGTLANARTTASSANGASTIVARDASGNFSANTITANLTGTAANATVLETARTIAGQSFDGSANITIASTDLSDSGSIDAATLDSIDSSSFLRSDAEDTKTSGDLNFSDNVKAVFGAGDDLQIYHSGTGSLISEVGTGSLTIQGTNLNLQNGTGTATYLTCTDGDAVALRYNGSEKFTTTSGGVSVTGAMYASGNIGLDSTDYIAWSNNTHLSMYVNGNEEARLESDGDFHADGDVIAFSTTISDRRLKDEITNISEALDKVGKINGVTFVRKNNGQKAAGVVAQEIMEVLPEAVKEKALPLQTGSEDDLYYVVEYDAITGLLVEAVKELKARVEALEAK